VVDEVTGNSHSVTIASVIRPLRFYAMTAFIRCFLIKKGYSAEGFAPTDNAMHTLLLSWRHHYLP